MDSWGVLVKLRDIIKNVEIRSMVGNRDDDILDIAYDSRKVKPGYMFVCLEGSGRDGHDYIEEAIKRGAGTIVVQKEMTLSGVNVIVSDCTRRTLAFMSANFFKHPASELLAVGITGTKGKTTTSCMVRSILEESGIKTGLIGTLGIIAGDETIGSSNTTPESYEIQKNLRYMVDKGCKGVVIEASSIGLREHRLDGFKFDYGVFTNFSEDHIGGNEHKDMDEYLECKSILFRKSRVGFVNIDDENANRMLENNTCDAVRTFGFSDKAQVRGENAELVSDRGHLGCKFKVSGKVNFEAYIPIPGKFNVYNALAAIAVCNYMGIDKQDIMLGLKNTVVKGRVESVNVSGDYALIIDYAHNAASMESLLTTLKKYKHNRIVTLFGAGGNRPKIRRYEMGEICGKFADLSVVTEDNSRDEDVMDIISDIKMGLDKTEGKYVVIPDRRQAIRYCIENAQKGDIIVLAGKGHETYQETKGIKYPFDEREIISEIVR